MTLVYLTSKYPARSHTFIKREIEEVRKNGIDVQIVSIRKCSEDELLTEEERRDFDETWSIVPPNLLDLLRSHLKSLIFSPLKYFGAFIHSFKLSGWQVRGILYAPLYFGEAIYFAQRMREKGIRSVHVHFADAGAKIVSIASQIYGNKWMISLHGSSDFENPTIRHLGCLAKEATFVRCVSGYGASQIKRVLPRTHHDRVFVAYSGLPAKDLKVLDLEKLPNDSCIRLVSIGRLSPEKGQITLLQAMSELRKRGRKFFTDILGDGPDRQLLEDTCNELGISDSVCFHGSVDIETVYARLAEADIFVCPSFMEGLPQVLMESMLAGTPVVAPWLAGIPELVKPDKTGVLYTPGSSVELGDAILSLVDDHKLYDQIRREGRQFIEAKFLIEKTVSPLILKTRRLSEI